MTTFFTSDLHFGHANIIEYCGRPYRDVEEMDEDLIERFNSKVGPEDRTIFMGDILMGRFDVSIERLEQLNGELIVVPGNHDPLFPTHGARQSRKDRFTDCFDEVWELSGKYDLDGVGVNYCHFPYVPDPWDRAELEPYRPVDDGLWLIHGHVHDMWLQQGRQINVGVDAWNGFPVEEESLAALVHGPEIDRPRMEWKR